MLSLKNTMQVYENIRIKRNMVKSPFQKPVLRFLLEEAFYDGTVFP